MTNDGTRVRQALESEFLDQGSTIYRALVAVDFTSGLWAGLSEETRLAAKQVKDLDFRLHLLVNAARFLAWSRQAQSKAEAAAGEHPETDTPP